MQIQIQQPNSHFSPPFLSKRRKKNETNGVNTFSVIANHRELSGDTIIWEGEKKKTLLSKIRPFLSLRNVTFKRKLLQFATESRTQEPNERQKSNKTGHELCWTNNSHSLWGSVSESKPWTVTAK